MLHLLPGRTPCPRDTVPAFRELEVSFPNAMSYKGGNGSPERIRNIINITTLISGRATTRMTITCMSTLLVCEKTWTWVPINLGSHLVLLPTSCKKPTTSTFSRSHALWLPRGVTQVMRAASVGICFVSSGIFHRDVSPLPPLRQVYGWSWLSALKTLIIWWNKNVILPTINKPQWHSHPTPTPPQTSISPSPSAHSLPHPKDIQILGNDT